jgi:hypothetical protein
MDGREISLRSPAYWSRHPRGISRDNGTASGRLDDALDRSESEHDESAGDDRADHDKQCSGDNDNAHIDRGSSGGPASVPPVDDRFTDSERPERYQRNRAVPTLEHVSIKRNDGPNGPDFLVTIGLLDDTSDAIGRYRTSLMINGKTLTEAQYEQNFVSIFIIIGVALALAAANDKLASWAVWLLGTVLAVFGLSEAVYYSKNGTFFTYGVTK